MTRPRIRLVAGVTTAMSCALFGVSACTALPSGTLAGADGRLTLTTPAATGPLSLLTWDLPQGEPTTLDYALAGDYSPDFVIANMCDTLFRLNPDFTYANNLVTSVNRRDPLTLILDIRQGVHFWDGTEMTAADVAYSVNREDTLPNAVNNYGTYIKSVTATGRFQVTVDFTAPDELFQQEMATLAGTVVEAKYAEKEGKEFGTPEGGVMCSGPYEFDGWQAGESITLKANPDYWNPAYRPKAATVKLSFITDTSALTQDLTSGAIDGAYEVPEAALPALSTSSTGQVYLGPSLKADEIGPAGTDTPADDPDVVRALSLALPRGAIDRTVYEGAAAPDLTILPQVAWGQQKALYQAAMAQVPHLDVNPTPADIAQAKALIQKAKPRLRPLVLAVTAGSETQLELATAVQQAAAQIGLGITIDQVQPLQASSMEYDSADRKGIDLVLVEGYLDIPDPLDYIPLQVTSTGIFNWSGYANPTVDADLNQAQLTLDPTARATLITKAQALYEGAELDIPVANPDEILYLNKQITGAEASFAYVFTPSLATMGKG